MKYKIANKLLLFAVLVLFIVIIFRADIKTDNNLDINNDVFSQYNTEQIDNIKYYGVEDDTMLINNTVDIDNFLSLLKHAKLITISESNKVFGEYNYEILFKNGDIINLTINGDRIAYNKHVYIIDQNTINELFNLFVQHDL